MDDRPRAGFASMHDDERKDSAVIFDPATARQEAASSLRVQPTVVQACRSHLIARIRLASGIGRHFVRPYQPLSVARLDASGL